MATKKDTEQDTAEVTEAGVMVAPAEYDGPTVKVRANAAKVTPGGVYTHPVTRQTIGGEAVAVPDDGWTRSKIRTEELSEVR